MSQGPHAKIRLPMDWPDRLEEDYRRWGYDSLKKFCDDPPTIAVKTLSRVKNNDDHRMTVNSLEKLRLKLRYKSVNDLLDAWADTHSGASRVTLIDAESSANFEERYEALTRAGLYDSAAVVARQAYDAASNASDVRLMCYWVDRIGDAFRTSGRLTEASDAYKEAWSLVQTLLADNPADVDALVQSLQTRFGQIMVDDYMIRASYAGAYAQYERLLADAEKLGRDGTGKFRAVEITVRRTHVRRQQAEMLRYMGRYGEALALITEVLAEYPPAAFESTCYGRLSQADCLRLLGRTSEALEVYRRLEELARGRSLVGLLGSVLWRLSGLYQVMDDEKKRWACLDEASQLGDRYGKRYRFLVIYCLLARASGRVADSKEALSSLKRVERFGPLSPDCRVAEYAYMAQCRAEVLRTARRPLEAQGWFRRALECYIRMGFRWGITRAWIGLKVTGVAARRPEILNSLEGLDAELLKHFDQEEHVRNGSLSMNLA